MKLLYITKTSITTSGGGGEKRAREVTKRLASRGHDVTIVCGKTEQDLPQWTSFNGCRVRHISCVPSFLLKYPRVGFFAPRYLFALVSFPILVSMLIKTDFDVIMENMTPYPTLTILLSKFTQVPIVAVQHEFHGKDCYDVYDPLTATIQLAVQNILRIFEYNAVVVPTSHMKRKFVEYGLSGENITVIPNGITPEGYLNSNIEPDPVRIVTLGRLTKRKGQKTVLRAFSEVQDSIPSTTLDVLGTGPSRDSLEKLVQGLELSESVTFHGFVTEEKKREILNKSRVFAFGSRQEGFGIVLLEAMAAGLPIVARDLPVYHEFFEEGENGYLINQEDPDSYANPILKIISNDSIYSDIRKNNLEKATKYSWESVVDETVSVIQSVQAKSK